MIKIKEAKFLDSSAIIPDCECRKLEAYATDKIIGQTQGSAPTKDELLFRT